MSSGRTALEGIRVLDVTQVMAGPFCAMQLCDMGADVIKVEPPGGDSTRRMAGASGSDSAGFNAVNRGKRSIVLDLRKAEARDAVPAARRAIGHPDRELSPGRDEPVRTRLRHAGGRTIPRLFTHRFQGSGQTGPGASRAGSISIAQGESGLMSVTGEPGRPPVKMGVPFTDLGAALFALAAILAALHYRDRTGRGQHVDTSLLEAGIALSVWEATEYFSDGSIPTPLGSAHRMLAPYQAIRCADGYITIGAGTNRLFQRLCDALGHPEWTTRAGICR